MVDPQHVLGVPTVSDALSALDHRHIADEWLAPVLEHAHRRQRLAPIARDLSTYGLAAVWAR